MKVIYITGPFGGGSAWRVEQNIRRAEALALQVWLMGAVAMCPHSMNRFFQAECSDEVWHEGTMELMKRCDAVLVVPNWEKSEGTRKKIFAAQSLDMPVFYHLVELGAWLGENTPSIAQQEITRVDHPSSRPIPGTGV